MLTPQRREPRERVGAQLGQFVLVVRVGAGLAGDERVVRGVERRVGQRFVHLEDAAAKGLGAGVVAQEFVPVAALSTTSALLGNFARSCSVSARASASRPDLARI